MSSLLGTLSLLNVGHGDITLSFNGKDKSESDRAARIIGDMLKKGFAILIRIGEKDGEPIYRRAKAFDPKTNEYIIAADVEDHVEVADLLRPAPSAQDKPEKIIRTSVRSRPKERRIPASTTHATAVGRTAGGYDPNLLHQIRRGTNNDPSVLGCK